MKKSKLFCIAMAVLALSACTAEVGDEQPVVETPEQNTAVEETESALIPGEIIVELSDELTAKVAGAINEGAFMSTKSEELNELFEALDVISVKPLYEVGGRFEERQREAGLHRWFKIEYNTSVPATKASNGLESVDGVLYVEQSRRIKPTAVFNDPMLPKQWHYYNDGSLGDTFKKGCDINVVPVWENYTAGKSNVIVAVEDGGPDMEHEDLAAVLIPGGRDGSKNFVSNTYKIKAHDHGTHVAGTIGAINNNGKGVCGIAGGRDGKGGVRLLSVQVFEYDENGKSVSGDFYNAMIWSADHGAVISQNSWGHVYDTAEDAKNGGVGSIKSAIDYFIKYAGCDEKGNQLPDSPMKGGLVVFAAGNEGWPDGWPAEYSKDQPLCVSVGAVGPGFTRATYSNYGDWVTIAAPGGDYSNGGAVVSTLPGNSYGNMQGTSMACPHVSGVAALLVSQFGGPGFTNEMLLERLVEGANTKALLKNSKIGPLVDALGSMIYGGTIAPDPVKSYTAKSISNNIDFTWEVTADADDSKAYGYILIAAKDGKLLENLDLANLPSGVRTANVEVGDKSAGDKMEGRISNLDFDTDYYVAICGFDYNKNYSDISPVKNVRTKENNPPVIKTDYSGDYKVKAHETLQVIFDITDPDDHQFDVSFKGGSDAATSEKLPNGTYRVTIVGRNADAGKYTAEYKVTDSYGMSTGYSIAYELLENHAPEIKKNVNNMIFEETAQKVALNMDDYITDPDGEQLVFSVNMSEKGIVHINQVDNVLNLTTLDYGLASIVITGSDAKAKTCDLAFQVLVRDPGADPDVTLDKATNRLTVHDGAEKTLKVTVANAGGAVLFTAEQKADAFNPISLDMSSYAPGRYGVTVVSDGKSYSKTIVKL